MMTTEKITPSGIAHGGWLLEAFLLTSMTLVAMALGVGLYLQFGFTLWLAAASALSIYIALVSAHVLIRRSETISVLNQELGRLEDEVSKLRRVSGPRSKPASELGTSLSALQPRRAGPDPAPKEPTAFAMPDGSRSGGTRQVAQPGIPPVASLSAMPETAPTLRSNVPMVPTAPTAPSRRSGTHLAEPFAAVSAASSPTSSQAAERMRVEVSALDDDMDAINGMIRRLAKEMDGPPEASLSGGDASAGSDAAISASVDALRAAALKMRAGEATDPLPALTAPVAANDASTAGRLALPPPVGPVQARLAEMADAISAERLDVYLEPILGLGDRRAHHYEFSARLRTKGGESIGPAEYASLARGTGMLPLLDAACIPRTSTVAAYMVKRGSPGGVFISISGESLSSDALAKALGATYRRGSPPAERAILSISQADIATPAQWAALKKVAGYGLRLALENVTTFEVDFNALKGIGFSFVRVDAQMLLAGDDKGRPRASDLVQRFAQAGLTLIVPSIEDDQQLSSLQGYGIELGQGPLFGGPRPVKADVIRPEGGVAA